MARVFFVTNRNYKGRNNQAKFGGSFSEDGVAALRYGYAELSIAGDAASIDSAVVFPEPDLKKPLEKQPKSGSEAFLRMLKDAIVNGCVHTVIFIHGFNVSFEDALKSAALLSDSLEFEGKKLNVVLFSWPSDGKAIPLMSYYSDRDDARVTAPALARLYLRLWDFISQMKTDEYCGRALHILAHSMGNYVLRNGLQALRAKEPRRIARLFDQIILAAPDEDDDAFETDDKLRMLPALARQVTAYYNRNDRALLVSDKTKSNPDRLGSDGPRMIDMVPKKVAFVDCSRFAGQSDTLVQHSYFVNCKEVTADIRAVLEGFMPDDIGNREIVRAERLYRLGNAAEKVIVHPTPPA
ncbi:alpha/beta hydrolase [Sphingomonas crocodyli]|uniref:Alpha/beta fold hydrolase n=1 Tax=Sphingomonas crocodyli TaxID=1979270 RepID=A0A437M8C5_9SPHN|nr:alpha/beta fold hydrolase [Sphingomonas crocodyli]RVT93960.1 alpha/beta fold hydrolase [Sphingomonas crocodyli]